MRLSITIMVIALVVAFACPCFAGVNQDVKVAVHVRAHSEKLGCNVGTINGCEDIVTTYADFSVDAFPIYYDLVEYLGVQYALTWPVSWGEATFTSCSDLVIGVINNPGDDASHTWLSCQAGVAVAVPGYIWLYADSPGRVCVAPHSFFEHIYVLDCSEGLDEPLPCSYCAGVYGAIGDTLCVVCFPATEAATWGAIKKIFR